MPVHLPINYARKNGIRAEASGAWAANLLGVSTQVPARIVYLTNGPRRCAQYDLAVAGSFRISPSNLWIDALRRDYKELKVMNFGAAPSFNDILTALVQLENEVNQ